MGGLTEISLVLGDGLQDGLLLERFEVQSRGLRGPLCDRDQPVEARFAVLTHDDGALDRMPQLTDVSRPGVAFQPLQRQRVESRFRLVVLAGVELGIVGRDSGNIVRALPQRRHMDLDRVDAVEQVLPEPGGRAQFGGREVGGADHPCVDLDGPIRPHARDRLALERPQQLGLHGQAQVADLIQKQRPPGSDLEPPCPVLARIREGALAMAEQL